MAAVTGTYRDAQGDPASGYIRFTLKPAAVNTAGEQVVCSPVYGILDPDGRLSIDLIPDSELVVDGVAVYEVSEYLDGCHRTWHLALVDDQPVDLPSRWPGDSVGDVAVLPVPGPQGPEGERGPQGIPGQDGSDGLSAEWGTASTWAALPATGNWPGRKVHVLDGLGLCLAVWDGTGWRVDEQSDTGRLAVGGSWSPPGTWQGFMHRRGGLVVFQGNFTFTAPPATGANLLGPYPAGFVPQQPGFWDQAITDSIGSTTAQLFLRATPGCAIYRAPAPAAGSIWRWTITYSTTDPWPTTPPA